MPCVCKVQKRYKSFKKGNMPTHTYLCMNRMNLYSKKACQSLMKMISEKPFPLQYVPQICRKESKNFFKHITSPVN